MEAELAAALQSEHRKELVDRILTPLKQHADVPYLTAYR